MSLDTSFPPSKIGILKRITDSANRDRFFVLVCLAAILVQFAVVMSPRTLATQDGPMHLYIVDIVRGLLTHSAYDSAFEFRPTVAPYFFQYAALLGLETVFSPSTAEKILVCLSVLLLGFGVGYLAKALGDGWKVAALAAIAFAPHQMVYLGFLNFCLGSGMAFVLAGYWSRYSDRLTLRRGLIFAAGFVLLALTHPVPVLLLAILIGIIAIDRFVTVFRASISKRFVRALQANLPVLLPFVLAVAFAIWILRISTAPEVSSGGISSVWEKDFAERVLEWVGLFLVLPVHGQIYIAVAFFLLLNLVCLAIVQALRDSGPAPNAASWRPVAGLFGLLILGGLTVPFDVFGCLYFRERLGIFGFFTGIALIGRVRFGSTPGRIGLLMAGMLTLAVALPLWSVNRQNAAEVEPLIEGPLLPPGSRGLIVSADCTLPQPPCLECSFNPLEHAPVHVLRRSHAVLMNFPWAAPAPIRLRPESRWPGPEGKYCGAMEIVQSKAGKVDFVIAFLDHGSVPARVTDFVHRLDLSHEVRLTPQFALFTRANESVMDRDLLPGQTPFLSH